MTLTPAPSISLLIATCGRPDILRRTLGSLERQTLPKDCWELILVDNRPDSPNTREAVQPYRSSLPLTLLEEQRPGKNFALNTAVPVSRGDLIVFTDDDVVAAEDWLSVLKDAADSHPDFDIFGGTILPRWPDGASAPNYDMRHALVRTAYGITDRDGDPGPVRGYDVWGGNMMVRRRLFDAGHRFSTTVGPDGSENYVMGSETDFNVRMEALGHKCLFTPNAVVRHQIRPEQLSDRWLHGRTMRLGRGESRRWPYPDARRLMGIPLFSYRSVAEGLIRWLYGTITREPDHRAEGLSLWLALGRAAQYRLDARDLTRTQRQAP